MIGFVTRFLPSLLPAVSAFANPWVWGALAVALMSAFTLGWRVESWRWDAANTDILENNLKIVTAFWQRQNKNNQATARELERDRAKLDSDRAVFDEELANVDPTALVQVDCPKPQPRRDTPARVAVTIPAPPRPAAEEPAPSPRVHLSPEFCRLFNTGLAVGLPDSYGGWLADAKAGCAGPVEVDAVLRIAERNAEIANGMRSQLLGWQAKACREGWWKGAECNQVRSP